MSAKLQLDEVVSSVSSQQPSSARELMAQAHMELMETIKVPQNLRKLNCALPKPCYPDVRPNSPSAWTVAEQSNQIKKRPMPPPPPAPPALEEKKMLAALSIDADSENVPPHRDESASHVYSALPKQSVMAAAANNNPSMVSDYYSRRPLGPAAHQNGNVPPPPTDPQTAAAYKNAGGYAAYKENNAAAVSPRYAAAEPLAPIREREREKEYVLAAAAHAQAAPPAPGVPYSRVRAQYAVGAVAPPAPRVAGHPVRVQYQHRMW